MIATNTLLIDTKMNISLCFNQYLEDILMKLLAPTDSVAQNHFFIAKIFLLRKNKGKEKKTKRKTIKAYTMLVGKGVSL